VIVMCDAVSSDSRRNATSVFSRTSAASGSR
jgi:hypothetical protein